MLFSRTSFHRRWRALARGQGPTDKETPAARAEHKDTFAKAIVSGFYSMKSMDRHKDTMDTKKYRKVTYRHGEDVRSLVKETLSLKVAYTHKIVSKVFSP